MNEAEPARDSTCPGDEGEPVKKVAWNKINPQTIKKESLWTSIDEKRCQNKDFFLSIKENFATKTAPSKTTRGQYDIRTCLWLFAARQAAAAPTAAASAR